MDNFEIELCCYPRSRCPKLSIDFAKGRANFIVPPEDLKEYVSQSSEGLVLSLDISQCLFALNQVANYQMLRDSDKSKEIERALGESLDNVALDL